MAETQTAIRTAPSDHDDDEWVLHTVTWFEHWAALLRRRVSRAVCGVLLCGDPDRAEPGFDAPLCPACRAGGGRRG